MLLKLKQDTPATSPPRGQTTESEMRDIMRQWGEPVYWHVRRLVGSHDDAQDIVQETFIKVFQSLSTLRDKSALKAWIYKIATNEALTHLRQNQAVSVSIDDATSDLKALQADEYFDYSDLEAVKLQDAINSLPYKQRATFNLRYYDDMSYEDIAEATDTTAGTAKVNYHIAKNKIIEYMNSHD